MNTSQPIVTPVDVICTSSSTSRNASPRAFMNLGKLSLLSSLPKCLADSRTPSTMRLLEITEYYKLRLTKDLEEDELPTYTMLSHTWGPNEEEVTFQDLREGSSKHKDGYRKLQFCAKQTRQDDKVISGWARAASTNRTMWSSIPPSLRCFAGTRWR